MFDHNAVTSKSKIVLELSRKKDVRFLVSHNALCRLMLSRGIAEYATTQERTNSNGITKLVNTQSTTQIACFIEFVSVFI
nr:unnamed protein product [Haemonchus contortus]